MTTVEPTASGPRRRTDAMEVSQSAQRSRSLSTRQTAAGDAGVSSA
jgi:hypothetical protein